MQRGRAIVKLRLPSGGEINRAVHVSIGNHTDGDVIKHCQNCWPGEEVVDVGYELLEERDGPVVLEKPTADDIARLIVESCQTPVDLPDMKSLKIAILRAAIAKWHGKRQSISVSTGISVRSIYTILKEGPDETPE